MGIETAIAIAGVTAALATAGAGVASSLQEPPKAPALPPPTDDAELTSQVQMAEKDRKRKVAASSGQGSTILTSPLGTETDAQTAAPSLLGS